MLRSQIRAGRRVFLLTPVVDGVAHTYGVTLHPQPNASIAILFQKGLLALTQGIRRG